MWGVSTDKYNSKYKNKKPRYRAFSNAEWREKSYPLSEASRGRSITEQAEIVNTRRNKDLGADINKTEQFQGKGKLIFSLELVMEK